MKVLVCVRPYRGHLQPVIPVLEALVDRGHQIVVATADELAVDVEQRGFGWVPAGVHPARWLAEHPGEDPSYGAGAVRVKAQDLLDAAGDIAPDLVLRDATDLAPVLAAEALGLAVATFSVCHYLSLRVWRRLAGPSLAGLRSELGIAPDPQLASLIAGPYLDVMPPALQGEEVDELRDLTVIRYEPRDHDLGVTEPAPLSTGPPTVLVTLGTVFSDRARTWRLLLGAFAGTDLTVMATGVPEHLRAELGVPANVALAGYRPHSALLPGCRAIVCHGGFNTVLGAICAGVPLVCVPLAGDQYYNADVVERLGLGIRLSSSRLTQGQLRHAVGTLLEDGSYRARVEQMRTQIAGLPAPAAAVAVLEALGASAS